MFPTPFRGMAIIGFLLAMSCSGAGLPIAIGLGLADLCSGDDTRPPPRASPPAGPGCPAAPASPVT
jgi:hypothetical protein